MNCSFTLGGKHSPIFESSIEKLLTSRIKSSKVQGA